MFRKYLMIGAIVATSLVAACVTETSPYTLCGEGTNVVCPDNTANVIVRND